MHKMNRLSVTDIKNLKSVGELYTTTLDFIGDIQFNTDVLSEEDKEVIREIQDMLNGIEMNIDKLHHEYSNWPPAGYENLMRLILIEINNLWSLSITYNNHINEYEEVPVHLLKQDFTKELTRVGYFTSNIINLLDK